MIKQIKESNTGDLIVQYVRLVIKDCKTGLSKNQQKIAIQIEYELLDRDIISEQNVIDLNLM